jgi:BirA family biotin operon repressor/biotin-[acetyl-CoA-carboxylase] ligase
MYHTAPQLPQPAIGTIMSLLPEVDSTNNYAMQQVQDALAGHGQAWFAEAQYAGRGQRSKTWHSQPGSNIILSVALQPFFLQVSQPFPLSVAVALACYDFFSQYAGDETAIKWPNDLYWRDRKAGGILIENSYRGSEWQWAIVGIGININQTHFDPDLPNPVSLKQITGKNFDALALARTLCHCLETRYQQLRAGAFATLLQQYNAVLYGRNSRVKLKKEGLAFETTIQGVDEQGQLITADTLERKWTFEDGIRIEKIQA